MEQTPTKPMEETFDIRITNGAGKLLRALMTHFGFKTAKDTVGLALQLLDRVKDSKITIEKKDGTTAHLQITSEHDKEN